MTTVKRHNSSSNLKNRPSVGYTNIPLLVGTFLLLLPCISIYKSRDCNIVFDRYHLGQDTPNAAATSSSYQRSPSGDPKNEDFSYDQVSTNEASSLDDPVPLNVPEEEALKADVDDVADVVVDEKPKQRKRIQQVNATILTSPTKVVDHANYCTLISRHMHAKTLARVVLFQRDGRHQLRDFVTHYTRVLPYNSLVIMDHDGKDEYTKSLLKEYGQKGAHIWRCSGSFKAKATMWTKVVRVYGQDSGFVFPVDVDELMAVNVNNTLEWNLQAFKGALQPLSKSGKPFKMNWVESVPSECHVHMKNTSGHSLDVLQEGVYTSNMCDIRFVKSKEVGCMDKTFSRGVHFQKTDTGNHYGGTRRFPKLTKQVCEEKGLKNIYDVSNIALIHLKEKTFEDWLIHGLRGATDRGFHKDFNIDCNKVQQSLHYCRKWEKITRAEFSPYQLRKVYVEDVCPPADLPLLPVHNTFCDME